MMTVFSWSIKLRVVITVVVKKAAVVFFKGCFVFSCFRLLCFVFVSLYLAEPTLHSRHRWRCLPLRHLISGPAIKTKGGASAVASVYESVNRLRRFREQVCGVKQRATKYASLFSVAKRLLSILLYM